MSNCHGPCHGYYPNREGAVLSKEELAKEREASRLRFEKRMREEEAANPHRPTMSSLIDTRPAGDVSRRLKRSMWDEYLPPHDVTRVLR